MKAPSRLSSLLVRDGLVTVARMEQAFQRQVIFGGALDTILLEMSALSEAELLHYLTLASGLPALDLSVAGAIDPRATAFCPRTRADRHDIVPLALTSALTCAVTEPVDLGELETLATELAVPIQPLIVPEYRFHLLREQLFGVPPAERFLRLAARAGHELAPALATAPPLAPLAGMPSLAIEAFEPELPFELESLGSTESLRDADDDGMVSAPADDAQTQAMSPGTWDFGVPASVFDDEPTQATVLRELDDEPTHAAPSPATATIDELDPTPLEPAEAEALLEVADDRDVVFGLLIRAARSRASYAALLTLKPGEATVRLALSSSAVDRDVVGTKIPIDARLPGPLGDVADVGSPYIGPVASGAPASDAALAALGGELPRTALLLPITVRDRVVAVLYAHRGGARLSPSGVAELFPLAAHASAALIRAIQRAKSHPPRTAAAPVPPAPARPTVDDFVPTIPPRPRITFTQTGMGAVGRTGSDTPAWALLDRLESLDSAAAAAAALEALTVATELLPELTRRFPGRLAIDRHDPAARTLSAAQHGPLLAFVVRLGPTALPLLVDRLACDDRDARYYATLAAGEILAPAVISSLVARLFDSDYGVRRAAINALAGFPIRVVAPALEPVRLALGADSAQARAAARALAELHDEAAIPDLIDALTADSALAEEAQRALVAICKQDFGLKPKKWAAWWEKHREQPRLEWLLDGLAHSDDHVRLSASEELKRVTGEYFGYHYDLPRREREEARQRWVAWWQTTGRRRFLSGADSGA
ncbi:MAG: hypothetical protein EXR73_05485 [Myxococcales bacterium]|nr:hypothetical protein [Myxococcales bacterium]